MPKRCPNGTRRNKTTKNCEPTNKSSTRKSTPNKPKCGKGIDMPQARIQKLIKTEKKFNDAFSRPKSDEYYETMERDLNKLCFPKDTKWTDVIGFSRAVQIAIGKKR